MIFSKEQAAVINEVKTGTGNIIVQATAGAGKTHVLLNSLSVIPTFKKIVFLSFSKFIVDELRGRVPHHVKACTLHSLGYGMMAARYKGFTLDENKYLKIAIKKFPPSKNRGDKESKNNFKKACLVNDIVNYARMTLAPHTTTGIVAMCGYYGLDHTSIEIDIAIEILKDIGKVSFTTIDFTDMLYFPVIKPDLVTTKFDFVMIDEVQDSSACQLQFLSLIGNEKARYVMVGDEKQAIYAFAGSSVDSFTKAKNKFNAKLFNLSVSYRCPKNVVEFAQGIYDVIQYHDTSKEGDVRMGTMDEIREGDMVLCRNTLPLIYVFFDLIERDIKATIVGKDIESGLVQFAEQIGGYSFNQVERNMDDALNILKQELKELGFQKPEKHKKYAALVEKIQVINLILNKIDSPTKLIGKIHEIFHEEKSAARLMTIHKAKGSENNRVFSIESFRGKNLIPSEYAEQGWELQQENNLSFVSVTRAKEEYILLEL